jgi:hypothetical protein
MRPEDLIPAFASELRDRIAANIETPLSDPNRLLLRDCDRLSPVDDPSYAAELLNDLFDALNEFAAPYTYFGTNEGDGSDYGYWPDIESAKNDCGYVRAGDELPRNNEVLIVNDHGNATCSFVNDAGELTVYWEVV